MATRAQKSKGAGAGKRGRPAKQKAPTKRAVEKEAPAVAAASEEEPAAAREQLVAPPLEPGEIEEEVKRHPSLDWDKGSPAPTKLIERYTPFVHSIAHKIKASVAKEIDYEDLAEYGMLGLLEAAERFDPTHGVSFSTFAYHRVRGAIYDGLRSMGWLSRTQYARARYEERATEYLHEVEVTQDLGLMTADARFEQALRTLATAVQGLAAVYLTNLDGTESLQVKDDREAPADERVGLEEARALLREAITKLPEQEREIIVNYYYKEQNLQEIGDDLGLSRSWASRLHARAIDRLQRILDDAFS